MCVCVRVFVCLPACECVYGCSKLHVFVYSGSCRAQHRRPPLRDIGADAPARPEYLLRHLLQRPVRAGQHTVLTMLLHCCHTVDALLLRCCHTFVQDVCMDGSIFVDRDGEHFGHVLEYMRDGTNKNNPTTNHQYALHILTLNVV
jgi:hypothetical protein